MTEVRLFIKDPPPEGNVVIGPCVADSSAWCWKNLPLTVKKEVIQKTIIREQSSKNPSNETLVASSLSTGVFFLLFLWLYSRMSKRIKYLEQSIGKR